MPGRGCPVTTSSGKPPIDEQEIDSSWDSSGAVEPGAAGFESLSASMSSADEEEEEELAYGVGVPYGGNDRTEEIEPIALDMPFSSEDVMTPPVVTPAMLTPRRATPPRPSSDTHRDSELKAPVAQLVLSDLFDSTPPPPGSSLAPPDPAAFSTSRPPAKGLQALRRKGREAPAEEPADGGWGPSRKSADAQYFANAPTPRPALSPSVVSPSPRLTPARSSTPEVAARPYPAGAPTRGGFPAEPEVVQAKAAPPAPVTASQSGSARGAVPIISGGVVALPSINVLAETPFPRPDSVYPRAERARAPEPAAAEETPVATPVLADLRASVGSAELGSAELGSVELGSADLVSDPEGAPTAAAAEPAPAPPSSDGEPISVLPFEASAEEPVASAAAEPRAQPSRASSAPQRRSVPTLESVANAAPRAQRSASGKAGRAARERAGNEGPARLPSEVATSRPPDVLLGDLVPDSAQPAERKSSNARAHSSAPPGARGSSNPPPQSVLAALPSTRTGQLALPSVMLGQDVEAEPDGTALRRAQRAARQTVRIELPAGFGRPGSPLLQGSTPGAATALPLPEAEPTFRGLPVKRLLPWAVAGLLLLALCLVLVLRPRSGSLVVTALGTGHRAVERVQIFVDGAPLCDSSPCRISGLAAGNHQLRASAPGLSSGADQVVEISAGEEAAVNIELGAVEPEARAGGVRVAAGEKELTLFVDDRRVGKLPQTVSGLASGKHWIKLDAEDGSPPIEKSVNVAPGQTVDVDTKPAKHDKVVVTIRLSPDSEGASVTFDDAFLLDFPAELELEPHSTHTLSASKPGYEDFALRLDLGDEPEKRIEVALTPLEGGAHRPRPRPAASSTAALAPALRKPVASKPAASAPAIDPTQGLLNISSTPPSQIILNGKPLGSTPKTAVVVPGDSLQTIVFVHPKMGRRRAQKFVPAGKERTVSIRF
jgi:hypothetical protein